MTPIASGISGPKEEGDKPQPLFHAKMIPVNQEPPRPPSFC